MQVTTTTFLPILAPAHDGDFDDPDGAVLDEFMGGLAVSYSFGPPYGERLVHWRDLDQLGLSRRHLRHSAADNLDDMLDALRIHGQPPALMLSFDGLESSLLLTDDVWRGLADSVPGELVVGVPARDVVVLTGSESQPGLEKARRAIERVFHAGHENLITRHLLVRRDDTWRVYRDELM